MSMSSANARGVDVWNPRTGLLILALPEQTGTVYWLAWSPDGQRLAVSRSDGSVAIWDLTEIERVLAALELTP